MDDSQQTQDYSLEEQKTETNEQTKEHESLTQSLEKEQDPETFSFTFPKQQDPKTFSFSFPKHTERQRSSQPDQTSHNGSPEDKQMQDKTPLDMLSEQASNQSQSQTEFDTGSQTKTTRKGKQCGECHTTESKTWKRSNIEKMYKRAWLCYACYKAECNKITKGEGIGMRLRQRKHTK